MPNVDADTLRKIIERELSVSSSRLHPEGLASIFMTPEEIAAANVEYDKAQEDIAEIIRGAVSKPA
jgi:hypothetical protein